MVEDFIREYAKKIANKPEAIQIQMQDMEDNTCEIIILADAEDVGRLIGRDGKMVGSLKTFISGTKAKDGKNYRIAVQAH
ncbi:KH domain-containing protein [Helicobacter sp. MIT 21-1697]|uniref:KH domain-containing protein n=1 Tax=Helicobacter sp. MIT 21-1697 TaxID=2993733 RepID=UPI00224A4CA5|nr:KH domain-containing protein [Helicobacter sp. MIT 21-1697]MCX2716857.1 KH domain-containing protein [Helicobacter sp. MIT 21-1697]